MLESELLRGQVLMLCDDCHVVYVTFTRSTYIRNFGFVWRFIECCKWISYHMPCIVMNNMDYYFRLFNKSLSNDFQLYLLQMRMVQWSLQMSIYHLVIIVHFAADWLSARLCFHVWSKANICETNQKHAQNRSCPSMAFAWSSSATFEKRDRCRQKLNN